MLQEAGLSRGKYSSCVFYHEERKIRLVVHGDDFTVLGESKELGFVKRYKREWWSNSRAGCSEQSQEA